MSYRVYFTNNINIVISNEVMDIIQKMPLALVHCITNKSGTVILMLYANNITHIEAVEEGMSGVKSMPTPAQVRETQEKGKEKIASTTGDILVNTQRKYDEDKK